MSTTMAIKEGQEHTQPPILLWYDPKSHRIACVKHMDPYGTTWEPDPKMSAMARCWWCLQEEKKAMAAEQRASKAR